MLRGDISNLTVSGDHIGITSGSNHIHLLGTSLDFNQNAPTDEIKLAFSIINKDPDPSIVPDEVRILLEFGESDTAGSGEWARFEIVMSSDDYDFANSKYYRDWETMKGKIVDEVEKGYTLNDKIIRFSKVVVGK